MVLVVRLDRDGRTFDGTEGVLRAPRIGDVGTLVHEYAPGVAEAPVTVEMADDAGRTVWLADFARSELALVRRYADAD